MTRAKKILAALFLLPWTILAVIGHSLLHATGWCAW